MAVPLAPVVEPLWVVVSVLVASPVWVVAEGTVVVVLPVSEPAAVPPWFCVWACVSVVVVVEVCASAGKVSASARAVEANKRVIMADTPNSFRYRADPTLAGDFGLRPLRHPRGPPGGVP